MVQSPWGFPYQKKKKKKEEEEKERKGEVASPLPRAKRGTRILCRRFFCWQVFCQQIQSQRDIRRSDISSGRTAVPIRT